MNLQRREFIALVTLCAANTKKAFAGATPQALSQREYMLLDDLSETLLPRDDTGPGAHDAQVAYYIDIVLKYSPAKEREFWKKGLLTIENLAQQRYQQAFAECSRQQREELMTELTKNEQAPQTELDHFFIEFKRLAIDAFYASQLIQREHLGYKGNTAIAEFAGCTHPNFEHTGI
jgi:hypothetical protein